MRRRPLAFKILTGYVIIIIAIMVITTVGYIGMGNISDSYEVAVERGQDQLAVQSLITSIQDRATYQADLIINRDATTIEAFNEATALIKKDKFYVSQLADTGEEVQWFTEFDALDSQYVQFFNEQLVPAFEQNDIVRLRELDGETDVMLDQMTTLAEKLENSFATEATESISLAAARRTSTRGWMMGVASIAIIVGLTGGILVTVLITRPVKKVTAVAKAMAKGEVNDAIDMKSDDEIGDMVVAFNEMIHYIKEMATVADRVSTGDLTVHVTPRSEQDVLSISLRNMSANLRELMGTLLDYAGELEGTSQELLNAANLSEMATTQIAVTIQQVTSGITEQTGSINRTAYSIDQMAGSIDGVAKGAQEQASAVNQAAQLSAQISTGAEQVIENAQAVTAETGKAQQSAQQGAQVVQRTIGGMRTIQQKVGVSAQRVQEMGKRSNEIGAIVQTIDEIASQTNLLALNAAIEAARAGEHGKGFAVVADEVRKLAERASAATHQIGGLIHEIQRTVEEAVTAMNEGAREVDNGTQQANLAGEALQQIVAAIQAVNEQALQSVQTARDMSHATNELVGAMDRVSAVVEENTAAMEQMSATASEVTRSVESIASVSEENSAAMEEMGAGAEEMSGQASEVKNQVDRLSEVAAMLTLSIQAFKVEEEAGQPNAPAHEPLPEAVG